MRLFCVLTLLAVNVAGQDYKIGGEIRERFEHFKNPAWGLNPEDNNGYILQRYMLHADFHWSERFRLFGELKSSFENGRNGGPRRADEDKADVNQAFVEIRTRSLELRAGRQEVSLGSSRLVSVRDGPNVRQSFDGGRLTFTHWGWKIDALALRPAETNAGVFDDSPNHTQTLWGVYATRPGVDLYYLGLDRASHRFDQGASREQRHSIGARIFGKSSRWDHDYEAVWQFGSFGPADIRAWTVASDTGYTWQDVRFKPRFGLKADVASGDHDPKGAVLGTFNALFPKGAYFSQADLLGPYNLMDVHPSLTLHVAHSVSITPDADFFWRQSTHDGIYDVPGNLLTSGKSARSRYIGAHANVAVAWQATQQLSFEAHFLHYFPGEFLKEVALDRAVNFVGLWAKFAF